MIKEELITFTKSLAVAKCCTEIAKDNLLSQKQSEVLALVLMEAAENLTRKEIFVAILASEYAHMKVKPTASLAIKEIAEELLEKAEAGIPGPLT